MRTTETCATSAQTRAHSETTRKGVSVDPTTEPSLRETGARRDPAAGAGLRALFAPRSVAVVGAREAEGNRGAAAVRFLRRFGYTGEVFPVHPAGEPVAGYAGHRDLADLPTAPELAIVGVGAARVPDLVPRLADAGVTAAIVWAGGFAETGSAALQEQLISRARAAGIRLLGPNCLGVVTTALGFTGTFASWLSDVDTLLPGRIGMVSQSGGLAAAAHSWAQAAGTGFSHMISTGNEADVGAVEALAYLVDDPGTAVLACYLEGLADGAGLISVLRAARRAAKPVVVLKGGRSAVSARAISAHTGALAGQARIWDAVLEQEGAVRVTSAQELLEVASFLAANADRPVRGNRVVVVSHGGGQGIVAADLCHDAGLEVPTLSTATRERLAPLLPAIASNRNPIDLTPEAFTRPEWRAAFPEALRVLASCGEADVILVQLSAMSAAAGEELALALCEAHDRGPVTLAVHCKGFPSTAEALLKAEGIHVFAEQSAATSTLGRVAAAARDVGGLVVSEHEPGLSVSPGVGGQPAGEVVALARDVGALVVSEHQPEAPVPRGVGGQVTGEVAAAVRDVGAESARLVADAVRHRPRGVPDAVDGQVFPEHVVHRMLAEAGLRTPRAAVVSSAEEAVAAAREIGFPVVLKVVSPEVVHRAEAGFVRLGLSDEDGLVAAYKVFADAIAGRGLSGAACLVQEKVVSGTELLVSAFRDPVFGLVVSCGAGGVLAELLDDVGFATLPLDERKALRLLEKLRLARHPNDLAVAGKPAAEFLVAFAEFAEGLPWARFVLELNPVSVTPEGAVALDGLLIVESSLLV
ncbi:acetate--CoA ligase family protein [Amycolatopsis rhabdoformis]|uniref:Acetate--CoA ligase family protein n=1 Tax=Amycolatopsis rhabdoformis TaxID=1448059 RepID=A0ABZ1IDV3_9PSEU|nr:acetate--CoA ligase family protein [Amycolatopsis rhabdoformis]WSE31615.1 acetate--CoA ligase family protein [Amycolatopsis rhabdoformis]